MSLKIKIFEFILNKEYSRLDLIFALLTFYIAFLGHYFSAFFMILLWVLVYIGQEIGRKLIKTYKFIGEWKIKGKR